jgi:sterol desaturase/sphingolipid hydroxylase (fatty acid hydroxylase superfamily)
MFRESPESPRIFESDFLDFFTRAHWATVPALFVPLCTAMLVAGVTWGHATWYATIPLWAAGFVGWTLAEYWLHRVFFHWEPGGKWGETLHFFVHGVHHKWPKDKYRLVMPPPVNLGLLFLVVGPITLLVAPSWGWAWLSGFCAGYMVYDVTHYYIHHGRPTSGFYKKLKAHHMNHHHNRGDRKFGVSFMVWDRVFGTT